MCDLCSPDKEKRYAAKFLMKCTADRLQALADEYRAMADGSITPHTDAAKPIGDKARTIIRELVDQFV